MCTTSCLISEGTRISATNKCLLWLERWSCKPEIVGSNPLRAVQLFSLKLHVAVCLECFHLLCLALLVYMYKRK